MYDQWNLNDDDFNSTKEGIEESSKYEYDEAEEIKEDKYNAYNSIINYSFESKNDELVLPRNNSFLNQKEKAGIDDSIKNNVNQKNKSFNSYSSFDDDTEEFIRKNKPVTNNKFRRVDPAKPNTGFDEFRICIKLNDFVSIKLYVSLSCFTSTSSSESFPTFGKLPVSRIDSTSSASKISFSINISERLISLSLFLTNSFIHES